MVKKGDKEAFGIVVDRYLPKIKRYAKKFIFNREDIDDLVQDVFLKAYANVFSFDSDKKFSPWVYRIAHNEFVNAIKKKMREKLF
jgi:RNA polymerase sigma-70 factor (ECF subfamily)